MTNVDKNYSTEEIEKAIMEATFDDTKAVKEMFEKISKEIYINLDSANQQ